MKKNNKFWEWLKRPRGFPLVIIYIATVAVIAASVVTVVLSGESGALGYVAYATFGIAAVLLAYSVYTVVIYAPTAKRRLTEKLKSHKFTANILENYGFKTLFFAIISFAVTVAFATMNLVSAIRYRLIWYGAISAYYFVLLILRGGIILADRLCKRRPVGELDYAVNGWKIYLGSGASLIILEIAMALAVTQMMLSENPSQGGQIMAITTAAYTFYKAITAAINLFKAKRNGNPVVQSLRNLNFADACMSVVSLTVLMISTFEVEFDPSLQYVKAGVGFFACAAIIAIASVMIIRSTKRLKALKEAAGDGNDALSEKSVVSEETEENKDGRQ